MFWFNVFISWILLISIVYSQNTGDVRLVGGFCRLRGRLEIFYNGEWFTVCEDNFDNTAASVVCKQLGASSSDKIIYNAGGGRGQILMNELRCGGNEAIFRNVYEDIIKLIVAATMPKTLEYGALKLKKEVSEDVYKGDLRITSYASGSHSGRLEIFHSGKWGTVCNKSFGYDEARVACWQLKRGSGVHRSAFPIKAIPGNDTIWLDDLKCTGSELSIEMCSHKGWGKHNCSHDEDVIVNCHEETHNRGDLRLVDGTDDWNGILQVYYKDSWANFCTERFDNNAAAVACRQLGYRTDQATFYKTDLRCYRRNIPMVYWESLSCRGDEVRLETCPHNQSGHQDPYRSCCIGIKCHGKCIFDGSWGQWATWTNCSTSCGTGTQVRNRTCDDPQPSSDGIYCIGEEQERQDCQSCTCLEERLVLPRWTFAVIVTNIIILTALISSTAMFLILRRRHRKGNNDQNASNPEEKYESLDATEAVLYETCT